MKCPLLELKLGIRECEFAFWHVIALLAFPFKVVAAFHASADGLVDVLPTELFDRVHESVHQVTIILNRQKNKACQTKIQLVHRLVGYVCIFHDSQIICLYLDALLVGEMGVIRDDLASVD